MKSFVIAALSIVLFSCNQKNPTAELKAKIVGILPYKGISKNQIAIISKEIKNFYGIETKILDQKELPKAAFINIKSPRYRADSIIKFQDRNFN